VPDWLTASVAGAGTDFVVVTPHWGPNMAPAPVPHVRRAAEVLVASGASLVAGHSAHVFHGVAGPVLFDLGDFIDDYAVDDRLRNDLGLIFVVTVDEDGPAILEAVPIALDFCYTRPADEHESEWLRLRFTSACADFGHKVNRAPDGRFVIQLR
jgi:poly-gamma-glutamate synthesis protein (capsule biosynthesis protein)